MTATRPAPKTETTAHESGIVYAYFIAKRLRTLTDGKIVEQWRAECSCGRSTDWHPSSNTARSFGRSHTHHPNDVRIAS